MKTIVTIFLTVLIISLLSCSSSKTQMIKFSSKPMDVYSNPNLKKFLQANIHPNIVLRVPNAMETVTTKNSNDNLIANEYERTMDKYYGAIEKELLKGGFSVRDRGLFNEVLKKMQRDTKQNIDYSQIKDLTNTDIILEVIKIDPDVKYVTNKLSSLNKRGDYIEKAGNTEYKRPGASAEFKIILVKNNEMAGTYTFHYAPCPSGCALNYSAPKLNFPRKGQSIVTPAYEGVETNTMVEFIERSTRDLIAAIK